MDEVFYELKWYKKMEMLRVSKGWGQREAAEKCSTTTKNYWNWEKGKTYPRHANRKLIARTFGLKMELIFSSNN